MNFVEELKWRGMLHDIMPGTEDLLNKESVKGYIGFDPTADSLGIGNMVQVMTLLHFQRCGHKPIALVGGATGIVGDPSGRSTERNMLTEDLLQHNLSCQKKQLEKFLDFNCGANAAEIVNNYDWFKNFSFLDFISDTGKHITVNYMMSKDSVKNRLENGMSFTEFCYQLIQGYDFYHLWKNNGVKLQLGGSDQWGNIVTGTELIRRKTNGEGEAYALTTQLIKKADGTKFGKSEAGNIWLDAAKTSPYKFYQFWLNAADEDVKNWIRVFSMKNKTEIEALESQQNEAPHLRILQKALAEEITIRVHSATDLEQAQKASEILFGKATKENLAQLNDAQIIDIFEGVPIFKIEKDKISGGVNVLDLLAQETQIIASKGEARKLVSANGIAINLDKYTDVNGIINSDNLINGKYIVVKKGKKDYSLVIVE
ncbi:MAG TPA: tyrosine--tRNA ligase [Chitinophagales bacterium]|jgi:tyrosyl-tRNA synthetase|nr:tyrosine--tRNA ligase [Chitinophagales bacterium]MBP6153202.1 tyrosine--tRNA ligase [Chitinophagales bacterium]HQV78896.1 tyrosine--tRNA ligase [Chitinophagales bacterium]HQW79262.1 tyrosine--tRNA ligase [Chitinophagales bacterium]HRB67245.1 tyrosine--tRNA ligase [Chitinophagales bacterium]